MNRRTGWGVRNADRGADREEPAAVSRDLVPRRSSAGFTYIALLAAIVIIGISLGSAGKYWKNVMTREKEEELLFRGDQYRQAIDRYRTTIPGRVEYPPSIDELLKDSRTVEGKRYLRQRYKDPVSGEDFVEVRDQQSRRIVAVHSPSDKEPLKTGNFPDEYREFEGKTKYSDWVFTSKSDLLQQQQKTLLKSLQSGTGQH